MLKDRIHRVVLDWDETVTETDTMSILAKASSASTDQWQEFVDLYMKDMEELEHSFGPRETLQKQYDFLGSLTVCELQSISRIESAAVFRGVTHGDIEKAAREVTIRDGFDRFCMRLEHDVHREILSVNWSREFIKYALGKATDADQWIITANSIGFDAQGKGTGAVSKKEESGIRTGMDKLKILKESIVKAHEAGGLLVYIGDSNTDLPALLEADLGIIFGENQSLQGICDKYAIAILSIQSLERSEAYAKKASTLYRATSWDEIIL